MATNSIYTVAGTGTPGFSGDGGRATSAQLNQPNAVAVTLDGGFLISEGGNNVVRLVSADGEISTVAGNATAGFSGDGGPATAAQLHTPDGISMTADGGFLIADHGNNVIRHVAPDGTMTTVAGTPGVAGFSGDGGPATAAEFNGVVDVASLPDGGFLVSDSLNHVVRRVAADGSIATIAGTPGVNGILGDGGPAVAAQLDHPDGVSTTTAGGFLVADANNNVIRLVNSAGTIDTRAGVVSAGFSGDGGPASSALLDHPVLVCALADGGFVFCDMNNHRVRRVSLSGRITTIAGNGSAGSGGDGGPGTLAELDTPVGVALTLDGGILIATIDGRVQFVDAGL